MKDPFRFRRCVDSHPCDGKKSQGWGTGLLFGAMVLLSPWIAPAPLLHSQEPAATPAAAAPAAQTESGPIAIVPLDSKNPDAAAKVTGALEVSQGKAIIAASGTVTSGTETTQVILPHRGVLRVCASTTVKLAADSSVPVGETPGLLMAMDHGAVEASFATGQNADILLTPDFRILIGGPGAVEVKVRLGQNGDTCVDNAGVNAPYVLVSSVFEGGAYRVQPGQRVMFEHGSLREVMDQEKEPCGCPRPKQRVSAGAERGPCAAAQAGSQRRESKRRAGSAHRASGLQKRRPRCPARSDACCRTDRRHDCNQARDQEKARLLYESWKVLPPHLWRGVKAAAHARSAVPCSLPYISRARSIARITACALLSDSWCSSSGTESATMPAPAWT